MGTELKYATDKQIVDFQAQALQRVSDSLDEWQRPSCNHAGGNCQCKHKEDFYTSHVFSVEDWLNEKFLKNRLELEQPEKYADPCFQIRGDFTQFHPAEARGNMRNTDWLEDKLPLTTGLSCMKTGSFLAVRCIYHAEAVGKIISRAKKTVKECEQDNGYYLYSERLMFKLVPSGSDIHLVMWFNYY